MEIKKVLVHSCFQKGKGFTKDTPLTPSKCRCRQFVTVGEAEAFVERGLAQHVVVVDKVLELDDVCQVCGGVENLKKSCQACGKTGQVKIKKVFVVRGEDIIFISLDGKRNTKTTQVKKSPTIEKAHIERAYVNDNKIEQARIESYGELNREFFSKLIVGPEPEDNPKTGTGRKYDWGRSI